MTMLELRKMMRKSQRDIAKEIGVCQATVNKWEHEDIVFTNGMNKIKYINNLENKYGIDFSGLIRPSSMNFKLKEGITIW